VLRGHRSRAVLHFMVDDFRSALPRRRMSAGTSVVEKAQSVGRDESKRYFLRDCAILVVHSTIDQSVHQVQQT
jgi:hypothetical protein